MRALKIIGIIILVIVGLFFLVAAFLPGEVHISETKTIDAPGKVVFEQINNLQNWSAWSPFQDSTMDVSYEGPEAGIGAMMLWSSEKQGNGKMEILESEEFSHILTGLEFLEYPEAKNMAKWIIEEGEEGTNVTWTLDVESMPYPLGRYLALAMPGWMQPIYQKGLDSLKSVCEALPAMPMGRVSEITSEDLPAGMVISITDSVAMEDMKAFFEMAFPKLFGYIMESGQAPAGMPYAKYHSYEEGQKSWVEAGMPLAAELPSTDELTFIDLPATKALKISNWGPYETIGGAWNVLMEYMAVNGIEGNGSPWEVYVNDPTTVAPEEVQTDIYFPIE